MDIDDEGGLSSLEQPSLLLPSNPELMDVIIDAPPSEEASPRGTGTRSDDPKGRQSGSRHARVSGPLDSDAAHDLDLALELLEQEEQSRGARGTMLSHANQLGGALANEPWRLFLVLDTNVLLSRTTLKALGAIRRR